MKKSQYIITIFGLWLAGCSSTDKPQDLSEAKLVIDKDDNGSLMRIGYMLDGKETGEWKSFVRERLAAVVNYKDGLQHGKETWFDKCSGRIIEEGYNEMGTSIGLWYRYTNGELVAVSEFKNDTSEIVYHNPKFKNAGEIPPPPSERYNDDCDEFNDY